MQPEVSRAGCAAGSSRPRYRHRPGLRSNDTVNCPARSRTRNRKPAARSPRSISRLRICCTVHGPSGLRGDPEDVHVAAAYLHDEQAVQALEGDRAVHAEEAGGEHRRGVRAQELPPCRAGAPPGRRRDLQRLEDPADRGCADAVTALEQFALDPLVSPAVVSAAPPDQHGNLCAGWRPACAARIGLLPGDQAAVPPQDGSRRDQPVCSQLSWQVTDQRGHDGSLSPAEPGLGLVRRSTATSCRSTSSSAFLDADERPGRTSQPQSRTKIR